MQCSGSIRLVRGKPNAFKGSPLNPITPEGYNNMVPEEPDIFKNNTPKSFLALEGPIRIGQNRKGID